MANGDMVQALRAGGSAGDYQVGPQGYFPTMPQFSPGGYGQPRGPGQPVISPEALQQAMAPPPAPVPEAAPTPPPRRAPPPKSVDTGRVREQPWTRKTFDANAYISQYPDLQVEQRKNPKFNAFDHWERYGQNENRFSGQSPQTSLGGGAQPGPMPGPAPAGIPAGVPQGPPPGFTPPTPEQIAQVRGSLGAPPMAPPPPPAPMNPVAPQIDMANALRGGGRGGGRGIRRY